MHIFITGTAGFIGSFLTKALIAEGHRVFGIDSVNDYYDPQLKLDRLKACGIGEIRPGRSQVSTVLPGYRFMQANLCDKKMLTEIFREQHFDCAVNLAAQAGVRYSLQNPDSYVHNNVEGFMHLLEACRHYGCKRLLYASSSSVYGNDTEVPFRETARVDHPVSIYAATKKSNELMAYTYSQLYGIETTGLRFFTVYGPYGRPDMAPFLFADAIRCGRTVKIFNRGELFRDFTYIDDIVAGIVSIIRQKELIRREVPGVPAVIYNIGHGSPVPLMDFIRTIEKYMGREAVKEYVGMQPGDVYRTWADTTRLKEDFGYTPTTSLEEGIKRFISWFRSYYGKNDETRSSSQ